MNVAQFQNSLTYMGDWMTPFFSALWPLAAIVIAISLVAIVLVFLADIFVWLGEWITSFNYFHIRNNYDIKNDYKISNSGGSSPDIGIPHRPLQRYRTDSGKIIEA